MPTGYTYDVGTGKVADFRTFALTCARNFGALIHMRDEGIGPEIRHREKSEFYEENLRTAKARLHELSQMTPEQAAPLAEAAHQQALASSRKYAAERAETRKRYEAMLQEVERWSPPTSAHNNLRSFMAEQLRESIKFDCYQDGPDPAPTPPAIWLADHIAFQSRMVTTYTEEAEKERQRVAEANAWIDALVASLPPEPRP